MDTNNDLENGVDVAINNYVDISDKKTLLSNHTLTTSKLKHNNIGNGHVGGDLPAKQPPFYSQNSSLSIELKDLESYGDKRQLSGSLTGDGGLAGEEDDHFIRVRSARQSKKQDNTTVSIEVETGEKMDNRGRDSDGKVIVDSETTSVSNSDFNTQLSDLVNEITTKVLINQPEHINAFIADYLEDKLKRERKVEPVVKPKHGPGTLQRKNSRVGKMLFKHASLLAKTGIGMGKNHRSLRDMMMSAANFGSSQESQKWYYDIPEDKHLLTLTGHKNSVTHCYFYQNYIITSSLDTNICIFDLTTGRKVIAIPNHKSVHCFVVIPCSTDNKILILAGTEDGQVPGWRVKFGSKVTAKLKVMIPMHQPNPIRAMVASPGLKYLATGCCFVMTQISLWGHIEESVRGTLKTWDLTSVINYATDPKHYYDDINHTALKTYKQIIARTEKLQQRMASYSKLTDSTTKDELESFYGIRALAFTPDETKIVVGFGHPNETKIQDIKMMAVVDRVSMETVWLQYASFHQINGMAFDPTCGHPGGTWPWAFFVSTERHLYCAELEVKDESGDTSKVKIKFPWRLDFDHDHQGGAFSPDGRLIVSASGKHLLIFESSSGKQLATYSGHKHNITHVTYSSDGNYIGTASSDKTIRVWRTPSKTLESPTGSGSNGHKTEKKHSPRLTLSPRASHRSRSPSQNNDSLLDRARMLSPNLDSRARSRSPSPTRNRLDSRKSSIANGHIGRSSTPTGARSRSPSPHPHLAYGPGDGEDNILYNCKTKDNAKEMDYYFQHLPKPRTKNFKR